MAIFYSKFPVFSTRMVQARNNLGYSVKEVAKAMGFPVRIIEEYEKGVLSPDVIVLSKIALLYKVSSDFLIGLDEEPEQGRG